MATPHFGIHSSVPEAGAGILPPAYFLLYSLLRCHPFLHYSFIPALYIAISDEKWARKKVAWNWKFWLKCVTCWTLGLPPSLQRLEWWLKACTRNTNSAFSRVLPCCGCSLTAFDNPSPVPPGIFIKAGNAYIGGAHSASTGLIIVSACFDLYQSQMASAIVKF